MSAQIDVRIKNIDLSRFGNEDALLLARAVPGSSALEIVKSKVEKIFHHLASRAVDDDFDVAMLGVKLNYALPQAAWNEIIATIGGKFGNNAIELLELRIDPTQGDLDVVVRSEDADAWSIRKQINRLIVRINENDRVAPSADELLLAFARLRKLIGQGLSEEGFVADVVRTLAEVNRSRRVPNEVKHPERTAKARISHRLSQLIVDVAPEQQVGWSFKSLAYETEGAYREAEFQRLYNIQAFDTQKDWEGLLLLLGRLEGRSRDARNLGLQALIRFPESEIVLLGTTRALLREASFDENFALLSDLTTRLLSVKPARQQEAEIPTSLYAATHMRAIELGLEIHDRMVAGSASFIGRYRNAENLRYFARRFDAGALFLRSILSAARQNHSEIWGAQLEDILSFTFCFGTADEREMARKLGYAAIQNNVDVPGTRRWLAQLVFKLDGDAGIHESTRLLKENIRKNEDDESRSLLKYLENRTWAPFLSGIESKGKNSDVSRLKGVGPEHGATKLIAEPILLDTLAPIADYIQEIGRLKQLELYQDGPRLMLDMMKDFSPATQQGQTKLEMLKARFGDISNEHSLNSFSAKFELALRLGDLALLGRVQSGMPRLTALTLIARSLFGDEQATRLLLVFFSSLESLLPTDQMLIQRLKKKITDSGLGSKFEPESIATTFRLHRSDCLVFLMDANESHALLAA